MPTWKPSYPKHKPFNCGTYWHLRKSGLYLAVYDLIGAVTAGGTNSFFSSIKHVAEYFNADYEATRRVFLGLRKKGWLELNEEGHLYIRHAAWANTHPGQCNERELLPWQSETDPLVGKMYAAADGKLRLMERRVALMRGYALKLGINDEKILAMYVTALEQAKISRAKGDWTGTSPMSCFNVVFQHLKAAALKRGQCEKAEVLENVEL